MRIPSALLCIVLLFSFGLLEAQIPDYVPSNGLIGWWPFNGNANDESGNGNHGTVKGATLIEDRFGISSSSFYFNGIDNSIEVADSRFIDTTLLTISVWFNPEDSVDNKIISKSNWDNASGEMFSLYLENTFNIEFKSKSNCIPNNGWNNIILPKPSLFLNKWHHLVFSISTNYRKCYINGKLVIVDSSYKEIDVCPGGQLRIGAWWSQDVNYFKGKIDDIGIWNRELDSNEVQTLYNQQSSNCYYTIKESDTTVCPGNSVELNAVQTSSIKSEFPKNGLIGYWPFNGNANDESGNGNNGTVNGAILTTDRCGKTNSSYKFDGIDDFIHVASAEDLNLIGDFTLSAWISFIPENPINKSYEHHFILSKNIGITGQGTWHWAIESANNSQFQMHYNADPCFCLETMGGVNSTPVPNNWTNVLVRYNDSSKLLEYFKDGKVVFSSTKFDYSNKITQYPLVIGKSSNGIEGPFKGDIDDIAIWKRALTNVEIQQVYNSSPCGCTDTLSNNKFVWSDGQKGRKITVKPYTTTTYVLTVTDGATVHKDSVKVTIGGDSCITCVYGIKQTDTTICQGTILQLNATIDTTTASIPKDGLVGWWPFNGNANDESGNGNHGTLFNANLVKDRNNRNNSAYSLNGNDAYISIGNFVSPPLADTSVSITGWIKTDYDNPEMMTIVGARGNGPTCFAINPNNLITCTFANSGGGFHNFSSDDFIISDGKWHFFAMIYDGKTQRTYLDSNLILKSDFQFDLLVNGLLEFGRDNPYGRFFNGKIDDIAIWNRAISHAEVETMYELNNPIPAPSIPSDGLVGYWPFDGNAKDQTSYENHGTVKGATLTSDRCQKRNSAYEFNGIDNVIEVANSESLANAESITMSAWILLDSMRSREQGILTKWFQLQDCNKNTDAYELVISKSYDTGEIPKLVGATSRYFRYQNQSIDTIINSIWQHVVFVHDKNSGGKLYLDGEVINIYNQNGSICSSTNPLLIGADNNRGTYWRFFDGKIDDIAIWNRPLSDSEVTQVYNSGSCNCLDTLPEDKFTWSTGQKGRIISVTPNASTMYTLEVDRGKKIDRDTIHVTVLESPTPDIFGHVKVYERQINYSYYTPFNDSSTYEWSITGNGKLSSTNGGSSILVDFKEPGYAYLTVTETNKYGCKKDTTIAIRIYKITDIAESEINDEGLNIYPNPMNEFGSVMLKAFIPPSTHTSVSIVDMLGKNLITSELEGQNAYREIHVPIPTESLPNGIYMIQLRMDGNLLSKKLIINR